MENRNEYGCPLLNKIIDDELCLEINYEYLKVFKTKILEEYFINKEDAEKICFSCSHYPL